jgi:hypothetical protein
MILKARPQVQGKLMKHRLEQIKYSHCRQPQKAVSAKDFPEKGVK